MTIDKNRVRALLGEVDSFDFVECSGDNYTVSTDDQEKIVIGKGECFGKAIARYHTLKETTTDCLVTFSIFINVLSIQQSKCVYDKRLINNFTLLDEEQLLEHMNYIKDVLNLKFNATFNRSHKKMHIAIKLSDLKSAAQLRFILFWLRETYVFPYNLYLLDTYELQKRYPDIELFNLITIPPLSAKDYKDLDFSTRNRIIDAKTLSLELENRNYVIDSFGYFNYSSDIWDEELIEGITEYPIKPLNTLLSLGPNNFRRPHALRWFDMQERFDLQETLLKRKIELCSH